MPRQTDFVSLLSEPELLQLMLVACPDSVVATDRDNRIILYTGASETIFGFSPVEVMHHDLGCLFAGEEGYQLVTERLRLEGTVANLQLPGARKDGPPFAAAVSAAAMHDRYGDYLGIIAYIRDYTAVQSIEDALRTNNGELNRLLSELDHVAKHDHLTGMLHRGSAVKAAEEALIACGLGGQSLGVVLFDLDHFKSVNDSYGHLVGDDVLRELGAVLRQATRGADIIGRFGGEEFIAFLPGAELPAVTAFADRVRAAVEKSRVSCGGESAISITISAGVAAIPSCASSLQEAIRVADHRLYAAKRAGRNCIIDTDTEFARSAA